MQILPDVEEAGEVFGDACQRLHFVVDALRQQVHFAQMLLLQRFRCRIVDALQGQPHHDAFNYKQRQNDGDDHFPADGKDDFNGHPPCECSSLE